MRLGLRVLIAGNFSRNLVIFRGALIRELKRRGDYVVAVGPEDDAWVREKLGALDCPLEVVEMERASTNPVGDLWYCARLYCLMIRLRPDVVLTFTHKPNCFGALACRAAGGVPQVLMVEGMGYAFIDVVGWRKRFANWMAAVLYGVALRLARSCIYLNRDDAYEVQRLTQRPRGCSSWIIPGIGVDIARFSVRDSLEGPFTFLMIGRLLVTKGVLEYCKAAEIVRGRRPGVRFWLAGGADPGADGIPMEELRAACELGGVEYVGVTNDVEHLYAQCDAYVLPSYREGFPVTVMEAMACGRAVITTDVPGCRDAVSHGIDGLLVPAKDPVLLSEAMLRLVDDRVLCRRLGVEARTKAERAYDERILAGYQVSVIDQAVYKDVIV